MASVSLVPKHWCCNQPHFCSCSHSTISVDLPLLLLLTIHRFFYQTPRKKTPPFSKIILMRKQPRLLAQPLRSRPEVLCLRTFGGILRRNRIAAAILQLWPAAALEPSTLLPLRPATLFLGSCLAGTMLLGCTGSFLTSCTSACAS